MAGASTVSTRSLVIPPGAEVVPDRTPSEWHSEFIRQRNQADSTMDEIRHMVGGSSLSPEFVHPVAPSAHPEVHDASPVANRGTADAIHSVGQGLVNGILSNIPGMAPEEQRFGLSIRALTILGTIIEFGMRPSAQAMGAILNAINGKTSADRDALPMTPDAKQSPQLTAVIKKYQASHGLPQSGIADDATLERMRDDLGERVRTSPPGAIRTFSAPPPSDSALRAVRSSAIDGDDDRVQRVSITSMNDALAAVRAAAGTTVAIAAVDRSGYSVRRGRGNTTVIRYNGTVDEETVA